MADLYSENVLEQELENKIRTEIDRIATTKEHVATVVEMDGEGTWWVRFSGSDTITPIVQSNIDMAAGDTISVIVDSGEHITIADANLSNPPWSASTVGNKLDEMNRNTAGAVSYVQLLSDRNVTPESVISQKAYYDALMARNITAESLSAAKAYIKDLIADQIYAETLTANVGKIKDISGDSLSYSVGFIDSLKSSDITANSIVSDHATVSNLESTYATIDQLEADYITADDIAANYAEVGLANVNTAQIQNGVIQVASILDEQVFNVTGNKATISEINADTITVRNLNAKNLKIETSNGMVNVGGTQMPTKAYIDSLEDTLQQEIDGAVETFTSNDVPLLSNYPASNWKLDGSTAEEQRKSYAKHVGDICYVQNELLDQNGYAYRFAYDSTEQEFKWVLIKDSDVTKALSDITDLKTFESNTSSWILETDEGLDTIRENHTSLSSSFSNFQSTTFKNLSDKVDEQSSTITSMSSRIDSQGVGITDLFSMPIWELGSLSNEVAGSDYDTVKADSDYCIRTSDTSPIKTGNYEITQAEGYKAKWYFFGKDGKLLSWTDWKTDASYSLAVPSNAAGYSVVLSSDEETEITDVSDFAYDSMLRIGYSYADSAYVTTLSNTVSSVSQTATGNSNTLSQLTSTLGTNEDGTTTEGDIVHRMTSTESSLSGISSRVSATEAHVAGVFAVCDSSASTPNKEASIIPELQNWVLSSGVGITVRFENSNESPSPTLNVNSTGSKPIKDYSGNVLAESAYAWKEGTVYSFIYDGQNWRLQDSLIASRISSAESTITQQADEISAKVSKDGVIASINASVESSGGSAVKISADKVDITGTAVFSAINNDTSTTKISGGKIEASELIIGSSQVPGLDDVLIFKVTDEYSNDMSTVTLTAHVYKLGEDIASQYDDLCFAWFRKNENGTDISPNEPLVPLPDPYTNGRVVIIDRSDVGYGAAIVCKFNPGELSSLLDSDDNQITNADDIPIAARTPSGEYVRVADLTVETSVFDTDKVMVVGPQDEHLVSIATLKDAFGGGDYERLTSKPSIESVTLSGNKTFPELGIFKTDAQGYDVADDYTLTTMDINRLWANAQPVG